MDARRHYFFDLDGTLTESRSLIADQMTAVLKTLAQEADVVIISGARVEQMERQIPWINDGSVVVMGQSGNEGVFINRLDASDRDHILKHIEAVRRFSLPTADPEDQLEERGGQVSFSFVGHRADLEAKRAWDPDGTKRRGILAQVPLTSRAVEVRIGGTTCFDYSRTGWNKAGNIRRLLEERGWSRDHSIYIGDAFFEGGNDAIMKGEMSCVEVSNPEQTLQLIATRFLGS